MQRNQSDPSEQQKTLKDTQARTEDSRAQFSHLLWH